MRMKVILLATALLALALPVARAQEEVQGEIAVGANSVSVEDANSKAGEYFPTNSSGALLTWWNVNLSAHDQVRLDIRFLNEDDQRHSISGGFSNGLSFAASMNRFVHNLNHDPLTNLFATDEAGKIVRATDFDPGARYGIVYEDDRASLTYRPVSGRPFSITAGARVLERTGTKQHLSTGHCYTCHTVGQAQDVDQDLVVLGARVGWETPVWGMSVEATTQKFENDAGKISMYFENALQPVFKTPVFYNRVQFRDTTLPVGLTTEWRRDTQVLQGYWNGAHDHFDGTLALARTEAENNGEQGGLNPGLDSSYLSGRLRYFHDFGQRTKLQLVGRYESLDADDIAIDVVEPTAVAPAFQAGKTYADLYGPNGQFRQGDWDGPNYNFEPFKADYVRESSASRRVLSGKADVVVRLGKDLRNRLKVGLTGRDINRESFEVTDGGDTETTEYDLKAAFYGQAEKVRYQVEGSYYQAERVLNFVDGACRDAGTDPKLGANGLYPAPGAPWVSLQYFELYQLRYANLSNQPTQALGLRANASWLPSDNFSVTATGRWLDQSNDETQVTDWSRDYLNLGATVWWAPSPRLYVVGYLDWMSEDQEAHVCIPLMDG